MDTVAAKVDKAAEIVYDTRLREPDASDLAAIFDIDGTLLTNDQPIQPVVDLYNFCKKLGYTVFIVTARDSDGIRETVVQLRSMGIDGFHSVYFRSPVVWDIAKFKESSRVAIATMGYRPVICIGDTDWDMPTYRDMDASYGILLPQPAA